MVKGFNKGLEKEDKKKELLERLKNIEGKREKPLKAIKDQGEKQMQLLTNTNNKKADFRDVSLKDELNFEVYNEINIKIKRLIMQIHLHLSAVAQVSKIWHFITIISA